MKRVAALISVVLVFAPLSALAADTTINGWVSDAMCGAKHAGSGEACVKKCIEGGEAHHDKERGGNGDQEDRPHRFHC